MATDRSLFIKYAQEQLSPEEQQQLQDWLSKDQAHRDEFTKFRQDWEAFGDVYQAYTPDKEQGWQAIEQRLDDTPVVELSNRTVRSTWWLRAAAIAGVFFGLVYLTQWLAVPKGWGFAKVSTSVHERTQVTLADGTQVWLNGNTELRYPDDFNDSTRTVYLTGEAFFDVTRDESKPFQIISDKAVTRVLGTSFEVSARDTAVTVTVASGIVALSERNASAKRVVLRPGDQGVFRSSTGEVIQVDTVSQNAFAWHTRRIILANQPLAEVGLLLQEVYQREVQVEPTIQNLKLTAEFDNQSLEEVLDVLDLTLNIQHTVTDEVVLLKKVEK
ncbi:MAG: FecR domain-containing protein [Bacteroidota bacterium]